jgi:anti-sigma regulatory factor (Ser/Thr protein kinase)/GNAT superfamily N-acetyltransferase
MATIEKQLVKLTLQAEEKFLGPALNFTEHFLSLLKLTDKECKNLRLATEEACINVIQHAFDPDEEGTFDLSILQRPNKIVIAIEDHGLPVDFREIESKGSGLGIKFMKAFTDEIHFINQWQQGKRIELIKNTSVKDITQYLTTDEKRQIDTAEVVKVEDAKFNFRFLKAEDSIPLARCVYRSYGYSYPVEAMYYPERLREYIESGILKSCIVEDEQGEIIGHLGLTYEYPGAKNADSGKAVVDPRYRGHKLFKRMKDFLIDFAKESGMYGIFSECVSVHPYTQKGNLTLGGHELGVILGFGPTTVNYKKIETKTNNKRQAVVMFYLRTNPEPLRDVYLPAKHHEIVKEIIDVNELNRTIKELPNKIDFPEISRFEQEIAAGFGIARFKIIEPGKDFKAAIKYKLNELCQEGISCILLDMDLSEPYNAFVYADLEELGFFFSCIIPEMTEKGDIIRYQYLNNVPVDPSQINTAGPFGKKLVEYVLKEYTT